MIATAIETPQSPGSHLMPALSTAPCWRVGGQTADALARQAVHTVEPTMPLRAAGDLMLNLGAFHVLVVDPLRRRPLGVLSTRDIAGVHAWGVA